MNSTIASKIADFFACLSVGSCLTGVLMEVNQVLQLTAYCVAIVSGVIAAYYHYRLIKKLP